MNTLMKEGWFERLCEVLEADQRSKRALSLESGLGQNFISQMITNGKEPGIENLSAILDKLPSHAPAYVLLGLRLSEADLRALERMSHMKPGALAAFEGFLDQLAIDEENEKLDVGSQD